MTRCQTFLLALMISMPMYSALADTAIGVSDSGHYASYRGKPLLVVGDSGTQCVLQNANIDFERWVADCANAGLNTVHVWSFVAPRQQLDGSDLENRYGYLYPGLTPWARRTSGPRAHDGGYQWDLQQWDEGETPDHYWPRLRRLCEQAEAKGLLVGITVFWGWPKHPADWAYHPFNVENGGPVAEELNPHATKVQQIASPGQEVFEQPWSDEWPVPKKTQWLWERFADKLIRGTAACDNVFFVFMDEHSYNEGNGGDHFRQFFQSRGCRWVDWDKRRADVDFVFDPISHDDETGRNPEAVQRFFREPVKPFLILEGEPYQGEAVRMSAWSALMGGVGYVFHNDERQETVHTGIMGYDPKVPGGATAAEQRQWLGHASRFFNGAVRDLDAMRPMNELSEAGAFCLVNPGQEYVVYATPATGATMRLDLSGAMGTFACRFYDPRFGDWTPSSNCEAGMVRIFSKPAGGDWALLVQRFSSRAEAR